MALVTVDRGKEQQRVSTEFIYPHLLREAACCKRNSSTSLKFNNIISVMSSIIVTITITS